MKAALKWLLAVASVGGVVWVATPGDESRGRTELSTHMNRRRVCARSPFGCPEAVRISRKQAPWPGQR